MTGLRRLHRFNAAALGIFIAAHLGNHLVLTVGAGAHIAFMDLLRAVYRIRVVEAAIVLLFIAQIALGLALAFRRGRPQGNWAWLQTLSGLYLAFFLCQHIAAVFWARSAFAAFDTNVYWAAAVVHRPPLSLYFIPYYGLAVMSVFTHIAAALHFRQPHSESRLPAFVLGSGVLTSALILTALTGLVRPISFPPAFANAAACRP